MVRRTGCRRERIRGNPHLPGAGRSGFESGAAMPPLRLLVDGLTGDVAQAADDGTVHAGCGGRHLAARRLVHERHELVRKAGHGAADADAAHVRATADAVDPAAFGHVALHHWTPAAKLHNAFRRAVFVGEVALLVVAGPVTSLVNRLTEQP